MGEATDLALILAAIVSMLTCIGAMCLYRSKQRLQRKFDQWVAEARAAGSVYTSDTHAGEPDCLRQRKSEFRALAENSPDTIVRLDRACRRTYVNPAAQRILGLQPEEIVGKRVDEVVIVSEPQVIVQDVHRVLDTGQEIRREISFYNAAGEKRYADMRIVPELDADGAVASVLAVSRDITERKRMESELQARVRELHALADSSPGMMGSFRQRQDGSFCMPYVSPNIEDLFGLRQQDVVGDASCLLMRTHPEDQARVKESIAASASAMKPWRCEYRILHSTKGERWMEGHTMPKPHPDGGVVWHGYVHDITARKLTQQRLKLLERAVNLSTDAIFLVDTQLRFTYVNSAACSSLGYTQEELLTMGPQDINPDIARDTLLDGTGDALLRSTLQIETRHRTRDGHVFPVEVHITRFTDSDRRMCLCVARDITERMQMQAAQETARTEAQRLMNREASLAQAQRLAEARGVFLARVSHELRTPLNGMLGYAQILLKDTHLSERQIEGLNIIEQSGEHLLTLVNEILDHAKLEANKLALHVAEIPLNAFLYTICGIIRIKAQRKNLSFACKSDADLPGVVLGDAQRLRQVLLNLLDNAVKCTDEGGIALRVRCADHGHIRFSVQDSGIGIDASQHEAIFHTYQQFGDESRRAGGVGLGLSISRQLVRLMGGDISVESCPGAGSTFSFEVHLLTIGVRSASQPLDMSEQLATVVSAAPLPEAAILPPESELNVLLELARRGNMRRIASHAGYLAGLDARYQPFVDQLGRLAKAYQSKAILKYIEQAMAGRYSA